MFNFTSLNKGAKFNFNTNDLPYADIKDVFFKANGNDLTYRVRAIYINRKSKFGESPVIALDNCLINLPQHTMEQVEGILSNDEAIAGINNGECGIKIYQYNSTKYNKVCYSVEWVNIKSTDTTALPQFTAAAPVPPVQNNVPGNNNPTAIF